MVIGALEWRLVCILEGFRPTSDNRLAFAEVDGLDDQTWSCVAELGMARNGELGGMSSVTLVELAAIVVASLAFGATLDLVHNRMAFRRNWRQLATEMRQKLDQRIQQHTARRQQSFDVCLSCDGFGTKPEEKTQK